MHITRGHSVRSNSDEIICKAAEIVRELPLQFVGKLQHWRPWQRPWSEQSPLRQTTFSPSVVSSKEKGAQDQLLGLEIVWWGESSRRRGQEFKSAFPSPSLVSQGKQTSWLRYHWKFANSSLTAMGGLRKHCRAETRKIQKTPRMQKANIWKMRTCPKFGHTHSFPSCAFCLEWTAAFRDTIRHYFALFYLKICYCSWPPDLSVYAT